MVKKQNQPCDVDDGVLNVDVAYDDDDDDDDGVGTRVVYLLLINVLACRSFLLL